MLVRLTALWPDGSVRRSFDLPRQVIREGSATADLRRDARRSASLTLAVPADGSLTPALSTDMLARGQRAAVEIGALVDGTAQLVPVMSGFVTACEAAMRGPTLDVSLDSHLSACSQEAGTSLLLPAGTPLPDALHTLWDPVLPWAEWVIEGDTIARTLGADIPVLASDDLLAVSLRLARSLGCEAYDDRLGRIVVRVRREPASLAPVRTLTGVDELRRASTRAPVNAQRVEATPGDAEPISVLEEVTDPASPIHRDRIGLRTAPTILSDAIPDPATARDLARSWLAGRMLAADQVTCTVPVADLDLDEGDVVDIDEPVTRTAGRFQLEALTTPLGPGRPSLRASSVVPLFLTDGETL